MTAWFDGPTTGFDLETTGIDTANDRVVTASVVRLFPATRPQSDRYLIALDIDIPAGATAIHGITTQHAREHGQPAPDVLDVVAADLALSMVRGTPVVGFNVVFDLSMLEHELRRHDLPTLSDRLGDRIRPVVCARVLDKQTSRRKGSRKLTDCCAHHGVLLGDAHEASADALAAVRLATLIVRNDPRLSAMSLDELHDAQVGWCAEQGASLQAYFRRQPGKEATVVDGCWPVCSGHDLAAAS